jgi:replicative DNA helicase
MVDLSTLTRPESEAGVIATLIHRPEYAYYSENLLPNHFSRRSNQIVYQAIQSLAEKGIMVVDAFNILEVLNSSEATKTAAEEIGIDQLNELIEMSDVLARSTVEEYQVCVRNVLDSAFRRDAIQRLRKCESLCLDLSQEDIEQQIYGVIDDVMTEYSYANDIPLFGEVVDLCWEEIKSRQGDGYAGIPFKFPTLNEYATIEKGELFIFAAEAKQGKSMMLLNCAMDLLQKGYKVLYIDSELNTRLFTARVISHLTGIEYKRLTSGNYSEEEAQDIQNELDWIKTRNFVHIYLPMFDKQTIYTTVKKIKHTMGLDVLIIDYFKSSGDGDAFNTYQELGAFVDMIKNKICGDMGICGIGAAQATSTGKVADSAKIGRNASTIALITDKTQEEIEADGEACGNKKLRVVLNRNGMQMTSDEYIDLWFNGNKILYEEARQHIPETPY